MTCDYTGAVAGLAVAGCAIAGTGGAETGGGGVALHLPTGRRKLKLPVPRIVQAVIERIALDYEKPAEAREALVSALENLNVAYRERYAQLLRIAMEDEEISLLLLLH